MARSFLENREILLQTLKDHKLHLSRKRGQNFLVDRQMREKIAQSIPECPCILEIGPGLGHLTSLLEDKTPRLICVELDAGFIEILREAFPQSEILHQDFLDFHPQESRPLLPEKITIVGNLPYYLSTKILEHILSFPSLPERLYIMLEKDFITEKLLNIKSSIGLQFAPFYQTKTKISVSKENFFPRPQKDSRFIELQKIPRNPEDHRWYPSFISLLFRRKNSPLHKTLSRLEVSQEFLEQHKEILSLRIHEISLEDIWDLYQKLMQWDKSVFQKYQSPPEPS